MDLSKNSAAAQAAHPRVQTESYTEQSYRGTAFSVTKRDDTIELLSIDRLRDLVLWASSGNPVIDVDLVIQESLCNIFDGIKVQELEQACIMAAVAFIERDPYYGSVASQLLLKKLFSEVTGNSIIKDQDQAIYRQAFITGIERGIELGCLSKELATFDLPLLAKSLEPSRDQLFDFMGMKTLYERYFLKHKSIRLELPQAFWMRVAMGLALNEPHKNARALEFYHAMSSFEYLPGTPTLLHSGLVRPQLSSCFLNTVSDDLSHIFKVYGDNAQLSKWSGGIGTDWTNIRATGSFIKTINTESQGLIPFLKIASDVTAAINRSGKRRAAACVYLETWHLDIEDFIDLRKNTGDDRRRTHDINTANWIPDLFIKRVLNDENWTLFCPSETADLHHLYGKAFELRYAEYEQKAAAGEIEQFKTVSATKLWRKMLSRLFETGHPWITFKDACNIRSPQDHVGIIHCSNLCTEITLNTSPDETAVCNLGSVNISKHIINGEVDQAKLAKTVKTAIRMLDNVIDICYYPTQEAHDSNVRHRPIGLGLMGFQDALYKLGLPFEDTKALFLGDALMEFISYNAILSSSELAAERGTYSSYKGSKWDRGLFPYDTMALVEQERGIPLDVDKSSLYDWAPVRAHVKQYGMRNSNTMAIAPTATISNIAGCIPCIEPIYKNIYVKANMSGEFTIVNQYLIADLKKCGLWDTQMLDELKYYDGNVAMIERIPQWVKDTYKEVFDIDPEWLLQFTARRTKWIDQSQSHNVFMKGVSGAKLNAIYLAAWKMGLKTTYYLRTLGATQIEKATLDAKKFGYTQKREYKGFAPQQTDAASQTQSDAQDDLGVTEVVATACSIMAGPDCESCQ